MHSRLLRALWHLFPLTNLKKNLDPLWWRRWRWRSSTGSDSRTGCTNPCSIASIISTGTGLHSSRGYWQLLFKSTGNISSAHNIFRIFHKKNVHSHSSFDRLNEDLVHRIGQLQNVGLLPAENGGQRPLDDTKNSSQPTFDVAHKIAMIYWFIFVSLFLLPLLNFRSQTFVVVSKGKDIFRFSASKAMWLLDPFNPIRRVAIYILVHPYFSFFIIVTILANCILMIMPTTPTIESTE